MSRRPALAPALALVIAAAAALGGCVGDLARRDAISPWAGDTQAQVTAAQAINPWPKSAYRKTWRSRPTTNADPATAAPAPAAPAPIAAPAPAGATASAFQ